MMMGYYHNDDETRKITIYKDNVMFYKTGDKGHINEDGCVFIIDRYKRVMMRPDGHTVHATPIENLLLSDPSIKDCAVVGLKMDVGSGVIPTAFLNIDENAETNIQALISRLNQLCRNNLPGRDLPMAYVIVEQIPYTLMGKVDFRKLEEKSICEVNPYIVDFTFVDKNGFSKL